MTEIRQELHGYLNEKNLNELLASIVDAILVDKPDNPIEYMTNHLLEKFPEETKDVVDTLRREKPPQLVVTKHLSSEEPKDTISGCSSAGSVDTEESLAPETRREASSSSEKFPLRQKRRESVSAETIASCVVEESQLKVIEKTPHEERRISQILKGNVFFGHLDEHQIETIRNVMFNVEQADGDVIIRQGDDGDNFYIIDSGSVEVFIDASAAGEKTPVAALAAGDAFGELSLMYNAPRAASCVARGAVRLWALDRTAFNVVLTKTTISKRKRVTAWLAEIPVFGQCTDRELLTIADALEDEAFEDAAVICGQGDKGDKFYLVNGGTAVCTIAQGDGTNVEVARLSTGSYFGEIALLTTKTRQATVTADGDLKCLSLNRRTFNRLNGPLQDILMRSMEEYNKFRASII